MPMNRSQFLSLLTVGSAGLAFQPSLGQTYSLGFKQWRVEELQTSHLIAYLGESFYFLNTSKPSISVLVLAEVKEYTASSTKSISLMFKGPANRPLPDGIYRIANQTFGEIELFGVSVYPGVKESWFEIIINRLDAHDKEQ